MMNEDARTRLIELIQEAEDALTLGYRRHRPLPEIRPKPRVSTAQGAAPAPALSATPPPEDRAAREAALRELEEQIRLCTRCPLNEGRTNAVPGMGVLDPLVMVIGEGPGAQEDARGEPFVGRAGQYLDKWLAAIELSRESNVYITNIVKCRPPGNRDPEPGESAACNPYLEQQIDIVRPRAILAVGRISSSFLAGRSDGIGRIRGKTYAYRGIPLVATYHPSGVLRNEQWRRPVWEDLKRLRALLDGTDPDAAPDS